ncbi:MAG: AAA family ATPase [Chlorobiaceae bacterium]|nr:AAA family ATPase [Chlorobiaceae bacterium]
MLDFNNFGAPKKEVDFATIKAVALLNIESVLNHWMPGGRVKGGEYQCGCIEGGRGESCSTNMTTGVGSDFAAGESWGDLIDLVAQRERVTMTDAAMMIADFLNITEDTPTPPPIPTVTEEEKRAHAAKVSMALWMEGETCPPDHPYLVKKQVNADPGLRFHPETGAILIPLRDETELLAVQRIFADGTKKVNHGGRFSGCYHTIQGERDVVYICEGYATAMTVHMATGKTAVMTVSASTLQEIARKVSVMYPTSEIIFAADNDNVTPKNPRQMKNPGVTLAEKARELIGRGTVIYPPAEPETKVDWNDFALQQGGQVTRELLLRPAARKRLFVDAKSMTLKEPSFLVDESIESPCTGMIFGPSGSGKSFLVFDLALCCATGKEWNGKKVKAGPVIYICGEGRHAIPRRVKAWETHHSVTVPYNRLMVSSTAIDFEPVNIVAMIAEINEMAAQFGEPPVMIIIDTMARALPGNADENSTKDTGLFIKECDRLQETYNCAVIIVHHTGHNETKRARGSSALKGAMDVEIMVSADGMIEWTKTKDIEPPPSISFSVKQIRYGEGKHENSCVLLYEATEGKKGPKMTANMRAALKALKEAIEADGIGAGICMLATWRDRYKVYLEGVSDRRKNQSFKEQVEQLEEKGDVLVTGSKVTAAKIMNDMITESTFSKLMKH